jgi:hypothetical protein
MHDAQCDYSSATEKQKKKHWHEFLNDNQNVWTALKYLEKYGKRSRLPPLQKPGAEKGVVVEENPEKAELFLQTFFPKQPEPESQVRQPEPQLRPQFHLQSWINTDIQEGEIYHAIFSSNPRKAPGPDDLPFRIWQELCVEMTCHPCILLSLYNYVPSPS